MAETKVPLAGRTAIFTLGAQTVGAATDVSLKAARKSIDVSRRSSGGHKEFIAGLLNWSVSSSGVYIHDDAGLLQLLSAGTLKKTALAMTLLDSDGYGFSGNVYVKSYGEAEPLNGAVMLAMEFQGSGTLTRVTGA